MNPLCTSFFGRDFHRGGRGTGWALISAVIALPLVTTPGRAQLDVPSLNRFGATDSSLAITAGEASANISDMWGRAEGSLPITRGDFPRDSIREVVRQQARRWLARLTPTESKGMEAEPFIRVLTTADENTQAERAIANRIATPALSTADRSFTYLAAVEAFADPSRPADLPLAERYLAKLNAMGASVAYHRYLAELVMVRTYDVMGRPADVARHGEAAVHLIPLMPAADVGGVGGIHDPQTSPYPMIVRAVSVQPGGKETIKAMNNILIANTVPVADSVALDSEFYFAAQREAESNTRMLKAFELVGGKGGPIYSNRWLNTSDSTAHAVSVTDGRVHVILTANYGCGICVFAAIQLQKIVDADSAMRAILVTWTDNMWGAKPDTPDSSAMHLTNFWVNEKKIHYPIALWIGHKTQTWSDGSVVEDLSDDSTLAHYPEAGKPQFYILDKEGRIRQSFFTFDRTVMRQIVEIVHSLEQEPAQTTPVQSAAAGQ